MSQSQRREVLVDTAIELFGEHGYHATGIDLILERAGVSKKTLYRHFRSKDELILAALKKQDGLFRNNFMRQVESRAETPRGRLLAVYDVAAEWFEQNKFFGCMFINAIGRGYIEGLCRAAGAPDAAGLADKLALLLEGATVTAQVSQNRQHAAQVAKTAAAALIAQDLSEPQDSASRAK
jgi:AcrR family transcriptional regulator